MAQPHLLVINDGHVGFRTRIVRKAVDHQRRAGGYIARCAAGRWDGLPQIGDEWTEPRDPRHDPRVGDRLRNGSIAVVIADSGVMTIDEDGDPGFEVWAGPHHVDLARWLFVSEDYEVLEAGGTQFPGADPPRAPLSHSETAVLAVVRSGVRRRSEILSAMRGKLKKSAVDRALTRLVGGGHIVRHVAGGYTAPG